MLNCEWTIVLYHSDTMMMIVIHYFMYLSVQVTLVMDQHLDQDLDPGLDQDLGLLDLVLDQDLNLTGLFVRILNLSVCALICHLQWQLFVLCCAIILIR